MTGFLLAGIGQKDSRGSNFLVVDASACSGAAPAPAPLPSPRARRAAALLASPFPSRLAATPPPAPTRARRARAETPRELLERTFKTLIAREDCGLLLINQPIADAIRPVVNAHHAIIPMILEIPSKDVAYDPKKDPLMKRVLQMLGEDV